MERLFTSIELLSIEENVSKNKMFRNPFVMNIYPYNDIKNILRVSQINGLILVEGNLDTGFEHIYNRHEFWTESVQVTQVEDELKKKNHPTKFRTDNIPHIDYCEIADSVYSVSSKNSTVDFDIFLGNHIHKDASKREYKLLLYRDTKVIHTLYPTKALNNIKQLSEFNFIRGNISCSEDYKNSIIETRIPYLDLDKKLKYVVVILKNRYERRSTISIELINELGVVYGHTTPEIIEYKKFISLIHEQIFWQYADLRNIESQIKKIENNKPQKDDRK